MSCLIVSTVIFLFLVPGGVTLLEYNHYWSKLGNVFISLFDKIFHAHVSLISYKTEPNTREHQIKIFKRWIFIGFILEALTILVNHLVHHVF